MNIRHLLIISLAANAVLVGFGIFSVTRWEASEDVRAEPPLQAQSDPVPNAVREDDDLTTTSVAEREYVEENLPKVARQSKGAGITQEVLAEVEDLGLRIVPAKLLHGTTMSVLDQNAKLSGQVRELFALSKEEAERLDNLFSDFAEQLRKLEVTHLEVVSKSQNDVLVRINPLESKARSLKEELRLGVEREMGHVDGGLLWEIMNTGPVSRTFWEDFGESGVEYTITLDHQESGINWGFERNFLAPQPTLGNHSSPQWSATSGEGRSPQEARDVIQRNLRRHAYLIEHLPEEFQSILTP